MYADSSFLVSLYLRDANSAEAVRLANSVSQPFVYSALHRLEIRNAFALAVFRGRSTPAQAQASWRHLQADLHDGILRPRRKRMLWPALFRRAAQIASTETPILGARSFDILHVACAEMMKAPEFVTFDRRQRLLAAKLGMQVLP